MNIALVVDDFHGGAGNIASLLAMELSRLHKVSMIMTNLHSDRRYPLDNIVVYDENMSVSGKHKIVGLFSSIKRMKALIRKKIKADLIISFVDNNNSLVCLSQWWNKTPIIVSERSNPLAIFPKAPWDKIKRIAYRRANVVSVQFAVFRAFDGGRFANKCRVTSNIVEVPVCRKNNWESDAVRFVTFGRLADIKRMDLMIKLFGDAKKQAPNMELHIFGDGPNKEKLQHLIEENGLVDNVFLRGYCNDVHQTMLDYDAYLMTSFQEGFPNSLSEAMAVGLPSVAFACHEGIVELAENGKSGFVAAEGDESDFVQKMVLLAQDSNLRKTMGMRAQSISARYSKEQIMAQWQSCIAEALQK